MLKSILNILAICGAAGFSGTMLCISVTLGGYWKSLAPTDFLGWFSANNHFISNAIPMVFLPTLIGVVGSIWLSWGTPGFKFLGCERALHTDRCSSDVCLFRPDQFGFRKRRIPR